MAELIVFHFILELPVFDVKHKMAAATI